MPPIKIHGEGHTTIFVYNIPVKVYNLIIRKHQTSQIEGVYKITVQKYLDYENNRKTKELPHIKEN